MVSDPIAMSHPCYLIQAAQVPYRPAWDWQRHQVAQRRSNPALADILLLLEHPPVYTLGRGATEAFLRFSPHHPPADLYRIERGGEVTYHCPGQIVGYPILNLQRHQPDLHWYLRQLETVLIRVLARYGLGGERIPGLTGVWVEGCKVAAIGIKVSRWITMHGFALNVCPDLAGFQEIVPCGIGDRPVGSLAQFIPTVDPLQVRRAIVAEFAHSFDLQYREAPTWTAADRATLNLTPLQLNTPAP
ncbi:MAG: lipoyl(octanoyl) transferase LipB [Prochlorothrix sp.]|nr:lipoyl(octanoyl) transferase LipB [Prochlorothrix sp.]